jgi:glycosidase
VNIAALLHRALDNWCYPLDNATLHLRLQTAADDARSVDLVAGDPFDWKGGTWNTTTVALTKTGCDGLHDFWETTHSPTWGRTKYYFLVRGKHSGDEWIVGERGILPAGEKDLDLPRNAFIFPYIHASDVFRAPDWVKDTVWYQIFPERFCNGDPHLNPPGTLPWGRGPVTNREFYGGDLPGITSRLDHLADLGVNGLYMTPVFASPSVHKYDTSDYLAVDPGFGIEADLKALVEGAHGRGIRVVLDAVFNHSGLKFAPWQDVLAHGRESKYAGWFHVRDWSDLASGKGYETFSFARGMPKLNTQNPEVRDYLIGAAVRWTEATGIDGWRLDVSNEVDQGFWREFRRAIKAVNPNAYIVGEVWHDALRWLRGDQYDAVMNYRYGNAVSDFVLGTNGVHKASDFARTIDAIDAQYPLPVLRSAFNVLDSHDTDRFITRCGGDKPRARLGWLLLFLLKGSPCVYYGSEVGMVGGQDPDNRRCMVWDPAHQDQDQFAFLKALTALRIREADLITLGAREWVLDPVFPACLGLRITGAGRQLEATLWRTSHPTELPPTRGTMVLENRGPWAYRVVVWEV